MKKSYHAPFIFGRPEIGKQLAITGAGKSTIW
jgi:hypothetical protein